MSQIISRRFRHLHSGSNFWLYFDESDKSQKTLSQVRWLEEGGMITLSDQSGPGGMTDVPLPRLLLKGDVMSGITLQRFLKFLTELNQEFLQGEKLSV